MIKSEDMTIEDKIIKALKRAIRFNYFSRVGVCHIINGATVGESCDEKYSHIINHYTSWEYYSGDPIYPIPSQKRGWSDGRDYRMSGFKWMGKRGRMRRSLCRHIIKEIEKDIKG